jgi:hypothetical protein
MCLCAHSFVVLWWTLDVQILVRVNIPKPDLGFKWGFFQSGLYPGFCWGCLPPLPRLNFCHHWWYYLFLRVILACHLYNLLLLYYINSYKLNHMLDIRWLFVNITYMNHFDHRMHRIEWQHLLFVTCFLISLFT